MDKGTVIETFSNFYSSVSSQNFQKVPVDITCWNWRRAPPGWARWSRGIGACMRRRRAFSSRRWTCKWSIGSSSADPSLRPASWSASNVSDGQHSSPTNRKISTGWPQEPGTRNDTLIWVGIRCEVVFDRLQVWMFKYVIVDNQNHDWWKNRKTSGFYQVKNDSVV